MTNDNKEPIDTYRTEAEASVITVRAADVTFEPRLTVPGAHTRRFYLTRPGEEDVVFREVLQSDKDVLRGAIGIMIGRTQTQVLLHRDDWPTWPWRLAKVMTAGSVTRKLQSVVDRWRKRLRSEIAEGLSQNDIDALEDQLGLACARIAEQSRDVPEGMYDSLRKIEQKF